jgi:phage-related protein
MRKIFLLIGAIFTALLMISTVTAVPQVNSDPLMDKINEIEENKRMIDEKLASINPDIETGGLIDLLIQIIQWIIALVQQIIDFILDIFGLVELIEYLIGLIVTLFELIMSLIDFIIDIFTPDAVRF